MIFMIVEKNTTAWVPEETNKCIIYWEELKSQHQLKVVSNLNNKHHRMLEDLLLLRKLPQWQQNLDQVNFPQPLKLEMLLLEQLLKH